MELKTVATPHVPVRYFEGGSGQAAGLPARRRRPRCRAIRSSTRSPQKFHVYAPLLPGYGDSEECPELRDMLDFTLHTWDVVEALGLKDPILVGHSMGGMIAAEMAAIAPNDVTRLALICAGGPVARRSSDPRHLLDAAVRDAAAAVPRRGGRRGDDDRRARHLDDPKFLQAFLVTQRAPARHGGQDPVPDPRARALASGSTASRRRRCSSGATATS